MEPVDYWRVGNIVLSFIAFTFLVVDLMLNYKVLTKRRLYLTFSLAGLLLATSLASAESIWRDQPLALRTPLYTACCLWTILGLWISRDDAS
jgi:hypothetical protein